MSVSTITYRTDKRQRARAQLHSCGHLLHKVMQRDRTMRGQSAFHPDKALRLSTRVSITDHSGRQHISTPPNTHRIPAKRFIKLSDRRIKLYQADICAIVGMLGLSHRLTSSNLSFHVWSKGLYVYSDSTKPIRRCSQT